MSIVDRVRLKFSKASPAPSLVFVSLTLRTFNNFQPLLERLRAEGWGINVVWAPSRSQPGALDPRHFGFDIALETDWREQSPELPYRPVAPDDPFWSQFIDLVETTQPVCVLSDDGTNWPSLGVRQALDRIENRPVLIAAQHGISQPWHALNSSFHFDFFLTFGLQYVFMFDQARWKSVLPTGLPKLDSLAGRETSMEGYLVFIAQHFPNPNTVGSMLRELRDRGFQDIRIRPHPGHPTVYDELGDRFQLESVLTDPIETIARANAVIAPHSTSVVEALLLNKRTVVLPSAGLTDLPLLPWVARDFTAVEVEKALNQARSRKRSAEYERFLHRICGGRSFRSIENTKKFIKIIANFRLDKKMPISELIENLWSDREGREFLSSINHPLATPS